MLRNLAILTTNGAGICGTPLVGVLASELPTGFSLPGLLNNDVSSNDPPGTLYRVEKLAEPSSGNFSIDEYGAFSFTDAVDATYTVPTRVYKNNQAVYDVAVSLIIGASGGVDTPPVPTVTAVTVSPATINLAGSANAVFSATVTGTNSPSRAVTWSTNAGSIDGNGNFVAPAATASAQTVIVTATSTADTSKKGTALVSIAAQAGNGAPSTVTSVVISPSNPTILGEASQQFTATVLGTNNPSQDLVWTTSAGSVSITGLFTAPASSASVQTITVTATSQQDATKKAIATITVPAKVIQPPSTTPTVTGVTVLPAIKRMQGGWVQEFTATVIGMNNPSQDVTWSVTAGQITQAGVFTAPPAADTEHVITVTATSTLDNGKKGIATVTVAAVSETSGKTVPVTILAIDQKGNPISGAPITIMLNMVDVDDLSGFVAPEEISVTADAQGKVVVNLWPNELGTRGSKYIVVIENPDTGDQLAIEATIPNEPCYLHQVGTLMQ